MTKYRIKLEIEELIENDEIISVSLFNISRIIKNPETLPLKFWDIIETFKNFLLTELELNLMVTENKK